MEDRGRDWFVGVDWASETHHVFVIDARGEKLGQRGFLRARTSDAPNNDVRTVLDGITVR